MNNAHQSQPITIEQAIGLAKEAIREGNVPVALELYNAVLQHQPNHAVAKMGLRKLLKGLPQGQLVQNVAASPSQEQINTLVNLYRSGQMLKTELACRELLQIFPQSLQVIYLLAATLQGQGKYQEALECLEQVIRLKPDHAEAYGNRGVVLIELGQPELAVESCEQAIRLKPDFAEAYYNRGNALVDLRRLEQAVENYEQAIRLRPDFAEAYSNCGNALKDMGLLEAAVESQGQAIRLNPNFAEAYSNRGNALKEMGQLEAALESYEKAIQLRPDYAEAYSNCGVTLTELWQLEQAVESCEQAIRLRPEYADAYYNLGNALRDLGQMDAAVVSYEQAIGLKPDFAEARLNCSALKKFQPDDAQIGVMESQYAETKLDESKRKQLSFVLAKAYEDMGDYDKSFDYLVEGNRLRKKELKYEIENDRKMIAKLRRIFSAGSLASDDSANGSGSKQPVFILGMPRSGTSLVEQILASHSRVHGAGELTTMGQLVSPILSKLPDTSASVDQREISPDEIGAVRDSYLETLTALSVPQEIVTDKMPLNFLWIGFILSAFPEAKVIHLNRDARATCWSNYKHHFATRGNGYAYDLVDLAEFYGLYTELMFFWHEQFPGRIYDLCYEELTENQEKETRKLLAYCDLEWQEQCLHFHETERAVKTASAVQVRKKMYQGSSEAWRRYEKNLRPLIEGLAQARHTTRSR